MKIIIDIPEEQINKSLKESKHIHEDEGKKGFVDIMMCYTNDQLDFVQVVRKTDFYSCKYKILPKGHGDLIDVNDLEYFCQTHEVDVSAFYGALIYEAGRTSTGDTLWKPLLGALKPVIEAESEE